MAGGQRRNDPTKAEATEPVAGPVEATPDAAVRAARDAKDDGDDIPNRDFSEQVRNALHVSTNREAMEQLAPYLAGLAK